jgi:ribonuclease HI
MPSRPTPPSLFPESPAKPAPGGWITAHCDGGARGNPGPAGYGAEITGPDGQVIAELSEYLGHRTNNYAEYSGLLASLQYALDHHHPRLHVISDSELMVKQIQGKYKVNSPDLKPLWQEAKNRIARLEAFEITHALRHKNKAADALANQAMDRGMNRTPSPNSPAPEKKLSSFATAGGPAPTLPKGPAEKKLSSGKEQSSEKELSSFAAGGGPASRPSPQPNPEPASKPTMLRGFTRDGVVHLLGTTTLPDGIFVKVIPE